MDPATIKEIVDAAEGVIAKIQKARADAKIQERLKNAKLPDELKFLEEKGGLNVMKAMIANGATDEQVDDLLHNAKFQQAIAEAHDIQDKIETGGTTVTINKQSTAVATDDRVASFPIYYSDDLGRKVFSVLKRAEDTHESIQYKDESKIALILLHTAIYLHLCTAIGIAKVTLINVVAGQTIDDIKYKRSLMLASALFGHDFSTEYSDKSKLGNHNSVTGKNIIRTTNFGVDMLSITAGVFFAGSIGKAEGESAEAEIAHN